MPIFVTCPHCQKTIPVKEKYAGKKGGCPHCRATLMVPPLPAEAAAEHAAAGNAERAAPGDDDDWLGGIEKAVPRQSAQPKPTASAPTVAGQTVKAVVPQSKSAAPSPKPAAPVRTAPAAPVKRPAAAPNPAAPAALSGLKNPLAKAQPAGTKPAPSAKPAPQPAPAIDEYGLGPVGGDDFLSDLAGLPMAPAAAAGGRAVLAQLATAPKSPALRANKHVVFAGEIKFLYFACAFGVALLIPSVLAAMAGWISGLVGLLFADLVFSLLMLVCFIVGTVKLYQEGRAVLATVGLFINCVTMIVACRSAKRWGMPWFNHVFNTSLICVLLSTSAFRSLGFKNRDAVINDPLSMAGLPEQPVFQPPSPAANQSSVSPSPQRPATEDSSGAPDKQPVPQPVARAPVQAPPALVAQQSATSPPVPMPDAAPQQKSQPATIPPAAVGSRGPRLPHQAGFPVPRTNAERLAKMLEDLTSPDMHTRLSAAHSLDREFPLPDDSLRPMLLPKLEELIVAMQGSRFERHSQGQLVLVYSRWALPENEKKLIEFVEGLEGMSLDKGVLDAFARFKTDQGAVAVAKQLNNFFHCDDAAAVLKRMGPIAEKVTWPYLYSKENRTREAALDVLAEIGTAPSIKKIKAMTWDVSDIGIFGKNRQRAIQAIRTRAENDPNSPKPDAEDMEDVEDPKLEVYPLVPRKPAPPKPKPKRGFRPASWEQPATLNSGSSRCARVDLHWQRGGCLPVS